MRHTIRIPAVSTFLAAALLALGGSANVGKALAHATCSEFGIAVHGQHIIGDYVTGLGALGPGPGLDWPPAGQVGEAVKANGGPVVKGGPGPEFHFPNGFAPGASFCLEQAHPNGFTAPGPHAP